MKAWLPRANIMKARLPWANVVFVFLLLHHLEPHAHAHAQAQDPTCQQLGMCQGESQNQPIVSAAPLIANISLKFLNHLHALYM